MAVDTNSTQNKPYHVALSFAGDDREYVRQVAQYLRAHPIKVFFDEAEQTSLWGKDLVETLARIYSSQSEFVVVFISKAYSEKEWTRHELRSALSAAIRSRREYILPVRFDQTKLDGLLETVSYLSISEMPPSVLGEQIIAKLQEHGVLAREDFRQAITPGTRVWRLSRNVAMDGLGATKIPGRWHTPGRPLIYTSGSLADCTLEMLVHVGGVLPPRGMIATELIIPPTVSMSTLYSSSLASDWKSNIELTQALGDSWTQSGLTCVLSVPSVLNLESRALLLNPAHRDFGQMTVRSQRPFTFDPRLFRKS